MADEKIIERIKKLFAIAEGASNSNTDSAEIANEALVAIMTARKLLAKHHLDESLFKQQAEIEHTVYIAPSFGQSTIYNPFKRRNARGLNQRRIWFEKLADVVAEGNYCKIGLIPEKGGIIFFGLEMDREVAIFTLTSLGTIADNLCKYEMQRAEKVAGMRNFRNPKLSSPDWKGEDVFIESFHQGFRSVIEKVFTDLKADENKVEGPNARDIYWEENCRYDNKPNYVWNRGNSSVEELPIEEYYVNIGKEIGQRAIDKLNLDEGTAKVTSIIQTKQIKKAEQETKRRLQLQAAVKTKMAAAEARIGIDYSLQPEAIIAIDDSGSMDNYNSENKPDFKSKIQQAKEGALEFAKSMNKKGYKVGLVTFGSQTETFLEPKAEINGEFITAIEKLSGYGDTPMHNAIKKANEYFKTTKARRTLMIVTDGFPSSKSAAEIEAEVAKENAILISTIGTPDAPKDFLDRISTSGESEQVGNNLLGEGIKRMAGLLGA